jgi:uncharacterized protein DUF5994
VPVVFVTASVRLTLAHDLGGEIDGAWWPRSDQLAGELPGLVAILTTRLGQVAGIDLNWTALQSPPNLNWTAWRGKHQHVITVSGADCGASLLIVPHSTNRMLATMVLRLAAGLPIDPAHRGTRSFETAASILDAARQRPADPIPDSVGKVQR